MQAVSLMKERGLGNEGGLLSQSGRSKEQIDWLSEEESWNLRPCPFFDWELTRLSVSEIALHSI